MSSRDLILGRVRRALADVRRDDTGPVPAARGEDARYEQAVPRTYLREHGARDVAETVDLLAENLADYRAIVHRTDTAGLPGVIAGLLAAHGSSSVLVPPALPEGWLSATEVARVADRADSTPHELDEVDSVVTACALAIAETGTIVLDGSPDQGRRRITLVPDHHVCVVRVPDQVVPSVPLALERLDPTRPLTWISGPSATSDIELDRVEGVHGPRTLEVVLVSGDGGE
ncbi:LutC/YkgG family protein [Streptomyces heilongjiangensis]|uniref:Lactate utilization protein C n=1 Tax=Streptomyces heilongjiangensis TaxID=945052 RepID=A0ABW1AZI1_9ACTN|nr:LUD domain-containing protein [Streptomyces heilongjiangensis]MDC2946408.1 LUD domain-containing protein [Streptomyces heilongjiangensis]